MQVRPDVVEARSTVLNQDEGTRIYEKYITPLITEQKPYRRRELHLLRGNFLTYMSFVPPHVSEHVLIPLQQMLPLVSFHSQNWTTWESAGVYQVPGLSPQKGESILKAEFKNASSLVQKTSRLDPLSDIFTQLILEMELPLPKSWFLLIIWWDGIDTCPRNLCELLRSLIIVFSPFMQYRKLKPFVFTLAT